MNTRIVALALPAILLSQVGRGQWSAPGTYRSSLAPSRPLTTPRSPVPPSGSQEHYSEACQKAYSALRWGDSKDFLRQTALVPSTQALAVFNLEPRPEASARIQAKIDAYQSLMTASTGAGSRAEELRLKLTSSLAERGR